MLRSGYALVLLALCSWSAGLGLRAFDDPTDPSTRPLAALHSQLAKVDGSSLRPSPGRGASAAIDTASLQGAQPQVSALALLDRAPDESLSGLACWAYVGGCGAGGGSASSTGGGVRWVGRGVNGGLLDLQLQSTLSSANGGLFATFNGRVATGSALLERWIIALNLPLVFKSDEVEVLGAPRQASLAGFGDTSLEIVRKLGITNATRLSLTLSAPLGASNAVREGIVLPQRLQLGSGTLGLGATLEHTLDRDWGLILFGGGANYGGWENSLGDFRAPSANLFAYAGYIWGPFVPSFGLSLLGKFAHDRERYQGLDDALVVASPSAAIEWATDTFALLIGASVAISYQGLESAGASLGIATSLF